MTELVVFPDVEALVVAALQAGIDELEPGPTVHTAVPANRPDEFVRVFRAGGPAQTLVTEGAQIIVEAWALDEIRAARILTVCRAYLNVLNGDLFGVYEISGPNNLPDPVSDQARYTQTFGVRARGSVLTLSAPATP